MRQVDPLWVVPREGSTVAWREFHGGDGAGGFLYAAFFTFVMTGLPLGFVSDGRPGLVGAAVIGLWLLPIVLWTQHWWSTRRKAVTRLWTNPDAHGLVLLTLATGQAFSVPIEDVSRVHVVRRHGGMAWLRLHIGRRRYYTFGHMFVSPDDAFEAAAGRLREIFPKATFTEKVIRSKRDVTDVVDR